MNKSKTSIFLILSASLVIFSLGSLSAYPLAARAACSQKDFTLTISPTSTSLTRGSTDGFRITIASVCGLTGDIGWGVAITSPSSTTGLTIHQATYHVFLSSTHTSGSGTFSVNASQSAALTTYTLTVTARDTTLGLSHSVTATLIVDDFTLTANPTKAKVSRGQTAFSTITVTGENGFSGTINYSVNEPSYVCNLQPDPVALSSTTTSISSTLSCNFSSGTNTVSISAAPNSGSPVRSLTVTITVH